MPRDFWREQRALLAQMVRARGMFSPPATDETIAPPPRRKPAPPQKTAPKKAGTARPHGGAGGRRMGQPFAYPPSSATPTRPPKSTPSPKRAQPRKQSPEEELAHKRATIISRYKVGCFFAFWGAVGSNDNNAGGKVPKQWESMAKARDYELWEAQVEYDKATGKSTAGPPPPIAYPDPPPQLATPPSPREWLGRP